jgi:hypothetical protein
LSWKEKNIVLSGLILIAWTIHSAISGMTWQYHEWKMILFPQLNQSS